MRFNDCSRRILIYSEIIFRRIRMTSVYSTHTMLSVCEYYYSHMLIVIGLEFLLSKELQIDQDMLSSQLKEQIHDLIIMLFIWLSLQHQHALNKFLNVLPRH